MIEKPKPCEYYDWIEIRNYLEEKYCTSFRFHDMELFCGGYDLRNGCLISMMEDEEFEDFKQEFPEEEQRLVQILMDEFGPGPYYFWW